MRLMCALGRIVELVAKLTGHEIAELREACDGEPPADRA